MKTRLTACTAILLGGGLFVVVTLLPWLRLIPDGVNGIASLPSFLFLSVSMILFSVPGILAVYYGVRLFKHRDKQTIKGATGMSAIIIAFLITEALYEHLEFQFYPPALVVIALILYVLWARKIIASEDLICLPRGEFVRGGIIAILAFTLFFTLTDAADRHIPREPGGLSWLNSLSTFGPILMAALFYKFGAFIFRLR